MISELRAATAAMHRALEDDLDIVAVLADPARREGMVARYRDFYLGADRALVRWPGAAGEAGPPGRARFGDGDGAQTPAAPVPMLSGPAEALGFLYVIEGSALGGRTILKELGRRGVDAAGLGFLDPRAGGGGAAWRGLLARMDLEIGADTAKLEQAVAGARKGFGFARDCLCGQARGPEPNGG